MVAPLPPGGSKFALFSFRAMHCATLSERPLLLATVADETSPFGPTLTLIMTLPDIVGRTEDPCCSKCGSRDGAGR